MYKKSSVFKRKYNSALKSNFFLFAYFPIIKAKDDIKRVREITLKNLNKLNLPSYYNLVKAQEVQNPRVVLIYTKNLNIKQITYLSNLKTTCFKIGKYWYCGVLLKKPLQYKTPLNLCKVFVNTVVEHNIKLLFFFSLSLKLSKI